MAKANKKGKGKNAEAETKSKKDAAPEFKFGVSDLADILGIKPASVRVQLRNRGIEKAGKSYGWNTKAELNEVADQLRSSDDGDEKPAKGKKAAKGSSKAKGKGKKSKKADADDE